MNNTPFGQRFSQTYLTRGEPQSDSKKARFRLSKLIEGHFPSPSPSQHRSSYDYNKAAQNKIESELGIPFKTRSTSGTFYAKWDWYFNRITITEVLDTITIITSILHRDSSLQRKSDFIEGVRKILNEENLSYSIDDLGGLHPLIDTAFSANQKSAIAGLDYPRYVATAECVAAIDAPLVKSPPDYKSAIRLAFGACENLFKLMYDVPRLDARTAGDKIEKDQQCLYATNRTLNSASAKTLESFKDWINAAHFYRHEEGVEESTQPTEEIAILLISQGLAYVRWLAALDRAKLT